MPSVFLTGDSRKEATKSKEGYRDRLLSSTRESQFTRRQTSQTSPHIDSMDAHPCRQESRLNQILAFCYPPPSSLTSLSLSVLSPKSEKADIVLEKMRLPCMMQILVDRGDCPFGLSERSIWPSSPQICTKLVKIEEQSLLKPHKPVSLLQPAPLFAQIPSDLQQHSVLATPPIQAPLYFLAEFERQQMFTTFSHPH